MSLTDTYAALDRAALEGFIANRQSEHLQLDFKTVNSASLNREDRRTLAQAISGFANSSGGLVVWGVDARPNSERIDCVTFRRSKLRSGAIAHHSRRWGAPCGVHFWAQV